MEKNISLNKKTNISLVQKALGEKAGVIGFSNDGYDDVITIVKFHFNY
mgnify:CR=1 FL=1